MCFKNKYNPTHDSFHPIDKFNTFSTPRYLARPQVCDIPAQYFRAVPALLI